MAIRELGNVRPGGSPGDELDPMGLVYEQAVLANSNMEPLHPAPSTSIPLAAEIVRGIVVAGAAVIAGAAIVAAAAPAAVAGAGAAAAGGELAGAGALAGTTAAAGATAAVGGAAVATTTAAGVAGTVATVAGAVGTAVKLGQTVGIIPGHHPAQPADPVVTPAADAVPGGSSSTSTTTRLTFWAWVFSLFGGHR